MLLSGAYVYYMLYISHNLDVNLAMNIPNNTGMYRSSNKLLICMSFLKGSVVLRRDKGTVML